MLEPLILLITHLCADNFQIFLFCPDLLYSPATDFFLFMGPLYLDVLPSPKPKHGKRGGETPGFPLVICLLCFRIARQRLWAYPAHSHSLTIHSRLLPSSVGAYSVFLYSWPFAFPQSQSGSCPIHLDYFKDLLVSLSAYILFFSIDTMKRHRILKLKCLLSEETNSFPNFNNLAADMCL